MKNKEAPPFKPSVHDSIISVAIDIGISKKNHTKPPKRTSMLFQKEHDAIVELLKQNRHLFAENAFKLRS